MIRKKKEINSNIPYFEVFFLLFRHFLSSEKVKTLINKKKKKPPSNNFDKSVLGYCSRNRQKI